MEKENSLKHLFMLFQKIGGHFILYYFVLCWYEKHFISNSNKNNSKWQLDKVLFKNLFIYFMYMGVYLGICV